ncbi:shikimate kinase [Simonsiella muelleri]|jgi:hypothetical protein|uniref:shikimate kinase n=1 Tax=Simonsiella muelleri TaxID=72 RepID=UPI0023F03BB5|nr:shikimate kinase [Simonsiella muelleri]
MNTKNIYLIGLMGAGKTTLGRQLAEHFQQTFHDSDQTICDKTGVSIPTIFELEGEQSFRERESCAINELTQLSNVVLATGGGTVLREQNRIWLRERGVVVYLHVLPEILVERTRYDFNRPLLQVDNPLKKMQQLYATRDPIYRQTSHIVLDVGTENHYITFKKLLAKLSES